jgi:LCP family protein required for cell wall assembly
MGLDKNEREDSNKYYNMMCADFLMLLVFDHGNKTCSAIHINRDTMAEMSLLGVNGKVVGTAVKQITLAHSYGSGSHDSCINTRNAVSKLLCGIPITNYVSLTMDAVKEVNDMVGGVTLEVLDDMTRYDPALKKGEIVTLRGEQALKYVRLRYYVDDSTNLSRMKRQRQYLEALYTKVIEHSKTDDDFMTEIAFTLSEYMVTNCSISTFQMLLEKAQTYQRGAIHSFEGETKINKYLEFYPSEEEIKRTVFSLFYKEASVSV